jgi:hypothetical protein
MRSPSDPISARTTPNPIGDRDPELLRHLTEFRLQLGDMLLGALEPLLNDPRFRLGDHRDPVEGIYAAAHVLKVLTKNYWTEEDVELFDRHWPAAIRSDLFADEFEADRFSIQVAAESASKELARELADETEPAMRQPTLW